MVASVIGWAALLLAVCQWAVWLTNRWFERRQALIGAAVGSGQPLHILIPARCERETLPHLLDDLRHQTVRPASVTVADDGSTDGMTEWLQSISTEDGAARYGELVVDWFRVQEDPAFRGNGKSRACDLMADRVLRNASSGWLVFLDADVRLAPNALQRIQQFLSPRVRLFSVIPALPSGLPDGLLVAGVPYSVLSLLPLPLCAYSLWPSTAFANGQLMAFRAEDYANWRPHRQVSMAVLDDVAIARWIKRRLALDAAAQGPLRWVTVPVIRLVFATDWMAVRMYATGRDAMNGFTKNAAEIGGPAGVFATLVFTIVACVWPISRFGQDVPCSIAVLLQTLLACSIVRCFRMRWVLGVLWPVMLIAWCGVMLRSWVLRGRGGVLWRGRLVGGS